MNTEHVFDFIMDPQELIRKTDAAAYSGSRFEEDATLFFRRSDDGTEVDYSSSSDALEIVNKGEREVKVTLTARVFPDSIAGITMSEDPEFPGNADASLYLALTDGEATVPVDGEDGAVIETVIPGVLKGEEPNEYAFQLIGAVNKEGDWSEMVDIAPKVTVTWMVSMDEETILSDEEIWDEDILDEDILDEDILDEDEIKGEDSQSEKEKTKEEGRTDPGKSGGTEKGNPEGKSEGGEGDAVFPGSSPGGNKPEEESSGAVGQERPEEDSTPGQEPEGEEGSDFPEGSGTEEDDILREEKSGILGDESRDGEGDASGATSGNGERDAFGEASPGEEGEVFGKDSEDREIDASEEELQETQTEHGISISSGRNYECFWIFS